MKTKIPRLNRQWMLLPIVVMLLALQPTFAQVLKHSYTFEDGTANDGTGSANGTLMNGAQVANGALILASDSQHVVLDAATIAINTYSEITIESFIVQGTPTGCSFHNFFGDRSDSTGLGVNYLGIVASGCGNANEVGLSVSDVNDPAPWNYAIKAGGAQFAKDEYHHMVTVVTADSIKYYQDGVKKAASLLDATRQLSALSTHYAWIGKSGYKSDGYWRGKVLEYNIYAGEMSAATIAGRASTYDNDGDNILNADDNCPDVANENQADLDNDGVGNVCDADYNPALLTTLTIDGGTFNPAFDPEVYEYILYPDGDQVTVNATATDLTVTGAGVIDVSSIQEFKIEVTGGGKNASTYTIKVISGMVQTHGYTFEDGAVTDAIGSLNGTVMGDSIKIENGKAIVKGATAATHGYITFDAAALALNTYKAVTMEYYVQAAKDANGGFTMLGYFGNNTGGNKSYWFQPTINGNASRVAVNNTSPVAQLNGTEINDGKFHHIVTVLSKDSLLYYLDGKKAAGVKTTGDHISTIDVLVANLFKGPDGWNDANFNGAIEEFNIFNGAMDAATVAERAWKYDKDKDLIADELDNCPDVSNPLQADDDNDGIGNSCDPDYAPALLGNLSVDAGKLIPAFDSVTYNYTVYVPVGVNSIKVTGTPGEAGYTVTGGDNSIDVSSGAATHSVQVSGTGKQSRTYTITFIGVVQTHGYTFEDGTANDEVGSLNGVLTGDSIRIEDGKLIVRGATSNVDGYLDFDGAALALNSYEAITLEFFVQSFNKANNSFTMMAYFGNNTGGNRCLWYQPGRSGNESRAEVNNGSGSVTAALPGTEIDDSFFHHIVVVLNSDSLLYYLDGKQVAGTALGGDYISNLDTEIAHLFKGANGWPDANYNGAIEEFNIYNGVMDAAAVASRATKYDQDHDLVADDVDNCPDKANPAQSDSDGDGIGNLCDPDYLPANLNGLTVDFGTLTPAFDAEVRDYTVYAPLGVTEVNVTPSPEDAGYTVTGGGKIDITSGTGQTSIVVSGTGRITSTYTVKIIGIKLEHSYKFEDGTADDAEGDLNGELVGSIEVKNGRAIVSGAASAEDAYISFEGVELALNSYNAITLEAFVQTKLDGNAGVFTMLAYFGSFTAGNRCLWFQPTRSGNESRIETNNGTSTITAALAGTEVDDGGFHHVVCVLNSDSLIYYLDGVNVASVATGGEDYISTIGTDVAYFFKGVWADPNYNAELEELNIYNGVMDPASIAARVDMFDNDGDGIVDRDDTDDDNDGQLDEDEIACGSDPLDAASLSADVDNNGIPDCQEADNDNDGIKNNEDNCPDTANADQLDTDNDGIGDVCDDDIDGDGVPNATDSCPLDKNTGDIDGDGIDEVCDDLSASNTLFGDLTFGEVNVGASKTKTFTVINGGNDNLEISGFTLPTDFTADPATLTVAGGTFETVKITFAPKSGKVYTGEVVVKSNAGDSTIAVSGTGIGSGLVSSLQAELLKIKVGPNPVDNMVSVDWSASKIVSPSIRVFDINGKTFWNGANLKGQSINIDIQAINSGLFFMEISSKGQTQIFKLVKN